MDHWSFSRDLDIVMVNCITLWGNRKLIPCGSLREFCTMLKHDDIIVLHHTNFGEQEEEKSCCRVSCLIFSRLTSI